MIILARKAGLGTTRAETVYKETIARDRRPRVRVERRSWREPAVRVESDHPAVVPDQTGACRFGNPVSSVPFRAARQETLRGRGADEKAPIISRARAEAYLCVGRDHVQLG